MNPVYPSRLILNRLGMGLTMTRGGFKIGVGGDIVKKLPLSQGLHALVDDADYEQLSKHKWSAMKGGRSKSKFYAVRTKKSDDPDDCPRLILLHRQIMGFPKLLVDHIDGDGLDNRRENLRLATHSENTCNRQSAPTGKSRFRGVYLDKREGKGKKKWRAEIYKDNKKYRLGRFETEEEAAAAYNQKAIELHGEFATLNKL